MISYANQRLRSIWSKPRDEFFIGIVVYRVVRAAKCKGYRRWSERKASKGQREVRAPHFPGPKIAARR